MMLKLDKINKIVDDAFGSLRFAREPKELYEPMDYILGLGGKRLRPRFCLTVYNLFKENIDDSIILPAVAMEVFHNFTLIHDDIMDKADIRRGKPTVQKRWNDNIAILSGDAMCIASYGLLANAPKECIQRVLALFSKSALAVCEGQQFDMNFETREDVGIDDYVEMVGLKTGVLIACSATVGAVIGGADDTLCRQIYDFGHKLGVAFQIQDDYFDSFGDEKVFGKKIGGDILNNKKTWLLIKSFDLAGEEEKKRLRDILAMDMSQPDKKIAAAKEIMEEIGVRRLAVETIGRYYREALQMLDGMNLTAGQKEQLNEFADTLISRIK